MCKTTTRFSHADHIRNARIVIPGGCRGSAAATAPFRSGYRSNHCRTATVSPALLITTSVDEHSDLHLCASGGSKSRPTIPPGPSCLIRLFSHILVVGTTPKETGVHKGRPHEK